MVSVFKGNGGHVHYIGPRVFNRVPYVDVLDGCFEVGIGHHAIMIGKWYKSDRWYISWC